MATSNWHRFLQDEGGHWDQIGFNHFGEHSFPTLDSSSPHMADLSTWGILQVSGNDARNFLQGQVSCDMQDISCTQWQRGAHCNLKGRALFSFYCTQIGDDTGETFLLLTPLSTLALAIENLKKYAVFSKVVITAVNEQILLGLMCPPSAVHEFFEWRDPKVHSVYSPDGITLLALPGDRYLCLVPEARAINLWNSLRGTFQPSGYPLWNLASIRAGIGEVEASSSGEWLPQFLNFHLTDGISFTKGCYLGQEVVARMEYRGKLKRHMRRAQTTRSEPPPIGTALVANSNSQKVGEIVSAVKTDSDSIELLVVVSDQAFDDDHVYLEQENIPQQKKPKLQFLSLPYAITK